MEKIDIYSHIIPMKYKDALTQKANDLYFNEHWDSIIENTPALFSLENRSRILDKYEGLKHVLTLASPAPDEIATPENAMYLAKLANDEMAELVEKNPDKYTAAVATVPMNDIDAACTEIDRAIGELHLKGLQLFTPVTGKPLDSPDFFPVYRKMAEYDLPIWIHPVRARKVADYLIEDHSKYYIYQMFGWPYETTVAMTRIVFSGIFDKYPTLKIIIHHCGAMIPYFYKRITVGQDYAERHLNAKWKQPLRKPIIDYFHMFYGDTALNGNTSALMCGYEFFSADHLVFGSDYPYDNEEGERFTREVIESVELMTISGEEKEKIFVNNAKQLLHLNT